MGCTGSKDKKKDAPAEDAPKADTEKTAKPDAPKEATKDAPAKEAAPEKDRASKMEDWMSNELKDLMEDYFNRYDLDGSQSINTAEELKQLCTNLVVKLDLEMDVKDIDDVVVKAGHFADDDPDKIKDQPKGVPLNEWKVQDFIKWFTNPDNFKVPKDWQPGDESDEDDDIKQESAPFPTGTYLGVLEGEDAGGEKKQYTLKVRKGEGKLVNGKYSSYKKEELLPEFNLKLRCDGKKDGDKQLLMPRNGCDSVGYFRTEGYIEGRKLHFVMEYDVDGDSGTVEPKFELDGTLAEDGKTIEGEWKQVNAEAQDLMYWIELDGVSEGTFKVVKRTRE
jgi:hypothetical protein